MTNPVSHTNSASNVATPRLKTREVQPKEQPSQAAPAASSTVTLSAAAVAALAAQKEALETPAQTAQEARGNDHQAQRLAAKEAAASAAKN